MTGWSSRADQNSLPSALIRRIESNGDVSLVPNAGRLLLELSSDTECLLCALLAPVGLRFHRGCLLPRPGALTGDQITAGDAVHSKGFTFGVSPRQPSAPPARVRPRPARPRGEPPRLPPARTPPAVASAGAARSPGRADHIRDRKSVV